MAPKSHQCLSCLFKSVDGVSSANGTRAFSAAPRQMLRSRRAGRSSKSSFPNVKAEDMGLLESRQPEVDNLVSHLKPYTALEKKLLAKHYTKKQIDAIEAGEAAIDPNDMLQQGRFRTDPLRVEYIDDFASKRPGVDAVVGEKASGKRRGESQKPVANAERARDEGMMRLSQQSGMSLDEIRKIRTKMLVTHRVVNQTRMGKIASLYYLTVAGNGDGMLGIGEGKAAEDEDGRRQAKMNAIRNMKPIPRYEDRTIYGECQGKSGASIVQLSSRPPGFGNRCQSLIYEVTRLAGISDIAARTPRSRNKMNVVKAAFQALTSQRLPDDVARARGRKMVDARGVYYGRSVH